MGGMEGVRSGGGSGKLTSQKKTSLKKPSLIRVKMKLCRKAKQKAFFNNVDIETQGT